MNCLQQKVADYFGPNDLYVSLTEFGPNCDDDVEEELWYGAPLVGGIPQECTGCEQGEWKGPLSGHGLTLHESDAWNIISSKLENPIPSPTRPQFYKLPATTSAGIARDIYFIAVPIRITSGVLSGRTRYLGFETEVIPDGQCTTIASEWAKVGPGAQLKVHANDGAQRWTGFIWLK